MESYDLVSATHRVAVCETLMRWLWLQAMAVHSAVLKGWKEMDDMTHADSLGMAKTLDNIRAQMSLVDPPPL